MSDFEVSDQEINDSDISFDEESDDADNEEDEQDDLETVTRPWIAVDKERYEAPFPVNPFLRRTGIANRMPLTSDPIDFFNLLAINPVSQQSIFEMLVTQTNLYAEQTINDVDADANPHARSLTWRETDVTEMKAFVGLLLNMGLIKKPTIESYWQEGQHCWMSHSPAFGEIMRRNRFQNILRYLHCNDNLQAVPRGQEGHDPGFKIRPVLELVNGSFSTNYHLGRDITVDESIVGFKGRNRLVQYMPAKKAHRWGPKFFLLAESDTGYIHQMYLYTGMISAWVVISIIFPVSPFFFYDILFA